MQHLAAIFATVFLAELGDKTQLATLLFATDRQHSPLAIFFAAAAALTASTACAVVVGAVGGRYLEGIPVRPLAGAGFILIGAWMIWEYYRGV